MKRYTETTKWNDPVFRRWETTTKTFWQYICDSCDNAGVWKIDYELASFFVGSKIDNSIINELNSDKLRVVDKNGYLIVLDFISFQIGDLDNSHPTNLQKNCISLLDKYLEKDIDVLGLIKLRPKNDQNLLNGRGINIKVKVINKGKEIKKQDNIYIFKELWSKYPKRVGNKEAQRHFSISVKTEKDITDIRLALNNYLKSERVQKGFIQNGSTWFNNWRDWIDFKEELCPQCKGKGKFISKTGYEIICKCPAGMKA